MADETVGVFVGTAFPGVVGRGKIKPGTGGLFDGRVAVKLGPVVGGNGAYRPPKRHRARAMDLKGMYS